MKNVSIPVGVSNFVKIRENGDYYIDKSGLIKELLKSSAKVTWITRPRRFGKTLNMSMLASFFDIRKNSKALFEGLEITENQNLCNDWMNQYPTLFLTFKDVDGLTFESARDMLRAQIAQICNEHEYLLNSKTVSENDKQTFRQLADMVNGRPDDAMLKISLVLLMRMMQAHYGKQVILLLDEYDVPMAKASAHGYYDQMLEIIRAIMSTALKDNSYLQFAVITGCLNLGAEINGIYRSEEYELPAKAVREMVANAVVHRSYLDEACVQVCIFDDRLEVLSPVMLYGGLDIATVKLGKSRCRNEAIAEAFHYMHIIESWGTGIPRLYNRSAEYGLPEPLFEEFGDGIKVTMFRKVSNAPEKVSNAPEKVSNSFERYMQLLKEVQASDKYIKNIEVVYAFYSEDDTPFGQVNIMAWLECSKSKATNIMHLMKMADLIEITK